MLWDFCLVRIMVRSPDTVWLNQNKALKVTFDMRIHNSPSVHWSGGVRKKLIFVSSFPCFRYLVVLHCSLAVTAAGCNLKHSMLCNNLFNVFSALINSRFFSLNFGMEAFAKLSAFYLNMKTSPLNRIRAICIKI